MAAICQWAYCGHAHEGADCLQCARAMARIGLSLRGCTAAQFKHPATPSEVSE